MQIGSLEEHIRELQTQVGAQARQWAASDAQLRAELRACCESREEIQQKCRSALSEQRDLEAASLRLERLAREMQAASGEASSLDGQLQAMHRVNAEHKLNAQRDAEEIARLRARLAQMRLEALARSHEEQRDPLDTHAQRTVLATPTPGTVLLQPLE